MWIWATQLNGGESHGHILASRGDSPGNLIFGGKLGGEGSAETNPALEKEMADALLKIEQQLDKVK